jgi:hypothetical protein
VVGGSFCDLEKAFDSVNHDYLLLCKLNFYGIRGPFYKLVKSYLTNRYQRVLIGGMSSHSNILECGKINHGVLQGSILGPLLFLFYINGLLKIVQYNSKPILSADETSLILSNPSHLDFKTNINNVFSHLNGLMIIHYF